VAVRLAAAPRVGVAVRLAVVAARDVVRAALRVAPRPICSTRLARSSIRLWSLATSAWLAVRLSWVWICLSPAWRLFSNDLPVPSIVLRKSGGTCFWTVRSASRPALTAWLIRLDLDEEDLDEDVRFLLAMA